MILIPKNINNITDVYKRQKNTSGNCKDSLREDPRQWVDFSSVSEKEYINTHNNQESKNNLHHNSKKKAFSITHLAKTYTAYTTYYFDQAYFEDNFEERNNSINQLLYSTTFKQQSPNFEYLNHQIYTWIAAHQSTKTPLETEEKSYQTVSVFNLFSSKSNYSTQMITPEPMANNPLQQNILIALQGIQTALRRRNNTSLSLFRDNAQDLIKYSHKKPMPMLSKESLNRHWQMLKKIISLLLPGSDEVVTEYAKAIRKLIKQVDSEKNWTEEQKIYSFTKELRTDLSYALWLLLALKDNPTIDMTIELVQRIKDNQRIHLGSTLLVFVSVSVMAFAPQMAVTSFAARIQNPNKQLIDKLTANLA
ncbi:hypothetical protein G9A89_004724 [Geosiphon pyriformis]|nr:hypothetical protein G9A89_004724 [Geosiphon pyriformis]